MKKIFRRSLSIFMALVLGVTSFVTVGISSLAETEAAQALRQAIEAYENKMDGTVYVSGLSAAYEAYVEACKAYDQCQYVGLSSVDCSAYTNALTTAVGNMTALDSTKYSSVTEWLYDQITYADKAADGSYQKSNLLTGVQTGSEYYNQKQYVYDSLSGAIYTYGVGSNAGYMQTDTISSTVSGTQFGTVVFLYTGAKTQIIKDGNGSDKEVSAYSFPVNFFCKRTSNGYQFQYAAFESPNASYTVNNNELKVYNLWHTGSSSSDYASTGYKGYSSDAKTQMGYYYMAGSTLTEVIQNTYNYSSNVYLSNTMYYTGTPSSTLTTISWPDYCARIHPNNNSGRFYMLVDGQNKKIYATQSATTDYQSYPDTFNPNVLAKSSSYAYSNVSVSQTSGSSSEQILIIDYTKLADELEKAVSTYGKYLGLGGLADSGSYYRQGGLSDYFKYLDHMLSINPTKSTYTTLDNTQCYIQNTTDLGNTVYNLAKSCADDIDSAISKFEAGYTSATEDTDYSPLRDDQTYQKGTTLHYDDNGNRLYGIGGEVLTTFENGNFYIDEEGNKTDNNTSTKVYTDDSWSIFLEALALAQDVLQYGAENGYKNDYELGEKILCKDCSAAQSLTGTFETLQYTWQYNGAKLENIDPETYNFSKGYKDQKDGDDKEYYYQTYGEGSIRNKVTAERAACSLTLAYENLKLNYDTVDARLLQALIQEAQMLLANSSYITDSTLTTAGLESLLQQAIEKVWKGQDFGNDANLLFADAAGENQKTVDSYASQIIEAIKKLQIQISKTVSFAGGYSLQSALAYCKTLNESKYTNWDTVLADVLAEAQWYSTAASSQAGESSWGSGTRWLTVEESDASKVSGSAYKYITTYIDLVERLYKGIQALTVAFIAIENGQVANAGETVKTAGTDTQDSNKSGYWDFAFQYTQGMTVFRTNTGSLTVDLGGASLTFGTQADYEQLLDSVNLDAEHSYTGTSLGSNYYNTANSGFIFHTDRTTGEVTGATFCLTDEEKQKYPGLLELTTNEDGTKGGTFKLYNLVKESKTGSNTAYGVMRTVDTSISGDDQRRLVYDDDYVYDEDLSTTEGAGGKTSSGRSSTDHNGNYTAYPVGGVFTKTASDGSNRGEVVLGGSYTYTLEEYTQQTLTADTKPTAIKENTDRYLGLIYYQKFYQYTVSWQLGLDSYYFRYSMLTLPYNPQLTVIDVSTLFDLISLCAGLDENDYTTDSWAGFKTAYQDAIDEMKYSEMTADAILTECVTRYTNLWQAKEALKPLYTLEVYDCENKVRYTDEQLAQNGFTWTNTKDDEAKTATFVSTGLPNNWYLDGSNSYTVAQGETMTITVHNSCNTETIRTQAQCSADGSVITEVYCSLCEQYVSRAATKLEATGDHGMGGWHTVTCATDQSTGLLENNCENCWKHQHSAACYETYGDRSTNLVCNLEENAEVCCEYCESEVVAPKVVPMLTVNNEPILQCEDGHGEYTVTSGEGNTYTAKHNMTCYENAVIQFSYPTEVDTKAFGESQYYIDFEYTDTDYTVLDWTVRFTAQPFSLDGSSWVEGTDYLLLQGGEYTGGANAENRSCLVVFRSARAQAAWDSGCVIINADTAVFDIEVTAFDCENNDIIDKISFSITNSAGETVASFDKGTATGLTKYTGTDDDNKEYTYYVLTHVADTYTLTVTDSAGYTLDDKSVTATTAGDRTYSDLGLRFHSETETAETVIAPTCTEQGYTQYTVTCPACSETVQTYQDNYTAALNHTTTNEAGETVSTWVAGDTAPNSCTEDGSVEYTCSLCGETCSQITYATGHAWQLTDSREPSCSATGLAGYVCANCGETKEVTLPKTAHSYVAEVTAPTCETQGYTTYTCEVCGDSYTGASKAAAGHSYRLKESVAGTCSQTGYLLYTCKNCVADYDPDYTITEWTEDSVKIEITLTPALLCTDDSHEHTDGCCAELNNTDGGSYKIVTTGTDANSHDYEITASVEANCENETDGCTTYTCKDCGETYTETTAWAHTYDKENAVLTAPTCTEPGSLVYTCTTCGQTVSEPLAPLGHSYKLAAYVAPTCTEAGYNLYICSRCVGYAWTLGEDGTVYRTSSAAADGETPAENTPLTDAGYNSETGEFENEAGEYYTVAISEAYGHSWRVDEEHSTAATCVAEGCTHYVCRYCGESMTENTPVDSTAHQLDMENGEVVEPTCVEDGYTKYTCTLCGDTVQQDIVKATGHHTPEEGAEGSVTKEPTCTEPGEMTLHCTVCDEDYTEAIPATGHDWAVVTVPASCGAAGYTLYVCKNTHPYDSESLEIVGSTVTAYTAGGDTGELAWTAVYDEETAAVVLTGADDEPIDSAEYYASAFTAAGAHAPRVVDTVEATCSEVGYILKACKYCVESAAFTRDDDGEIVLGADGTPQVTATAAAGCVLTDDSYTVETVAATGEHSWDDGVVTKEAACGTPGEMTYTCTVCGETKTEEIPATGEHSWGDWEVTTPATHTESGVETRTCQDCGATQTRDSSPTPDHEFTVAETVEPTCTEAGYSVYACICGVSYVDADSVVPATGHSWGDWVITKEATHTETGEKERVCEVCGATETGSVDKIADHEYKAVVTKPTCTAQGYTTYSCACGSKYIDDYTAPTGHDYTFTKYSVPATRNANGTELWTCTKCNGTTTKSYAKIKSWSLSDSSYTYNGKQQTPDIIVKDADGATISSDYYCYQYYSQNTSNLVSASACRTVGKYYVKVTFKGKYSGSIMVGTFTIKPKSTTVKSLTAASKGFKVKWTAITADDQVAGYQIQYSTSKSFSSKKTVTVSGRTKSSKTIKSLKAKKKYYVRIRTYKKRSGVTYYSSWSSAKTVTTKK